MHRRPETALVSAAGETGTVVDSQYAQIYRQSFSFVFRKVLQAAVPAMQRILNFNINSRTTALMFKTAVSRKCWGLPVSFIGQE